jgi:TonB-dependent SusC/RagA subfamily outer membrane receptor
MPVPRFDLLKTRYPFAALAIVTVALLSLPAATVAQGKETGVVSGVVIDQVANLGASGATITVSGHVDADGKPIAVLAGNDGRFVIDGVPAGSHMVNVRQDGYFSLHLDEIVVTAGDTTKLTLSLSAASGALAAIEEQLRSATPGTAPMLIIDGIILGAGSGLDRINPDNIASIEVVKGAAGTNLYGSRAANGIISITLKPKDR